MTESTLPQSVKVCLWSYDTDKIDLSNADDRYRIVMNVLNRGTMEAVQWLWNNFNEKEIADIIQQSCASEWNKQSLKFWSLIYKTSPLKVSRFATPHGTSLEHSR